MSHNLIQSFFFTLNVSSLAVTSPLVFSSLVLLFSPTKQQHKRRKNINVFSKKNNDAVGWINRMGKKKWNITANVSSLAVTPVPAYFPVRFPITLLAYRKSNEEVRRTLRWKKETSERRINREKRNMFILFIVLHGLHTCLPARNIIKMISRVSQPNPFNLMFIIFRNFWENQCSQNK